MLSFKIIPGWFRRLCISSPVGREVGATAAGEGGAMPVGISSVLV